jgi:3D (Asp-Asp-Asp) domain-containing protein
MADAVSISARRNWRRVVAQRATAFAAGLVLPSLLGLTGCASTRISPPAGVPSRVVLMEVTGYCNCGQCCSWRRTWFGLGAPVVSSGPNKGAPKKVGVTASGRRARAGTVAADVTRYPFGTVVYVPGYGYGRVEDTGGAIKGDKLDLWFDSHAEAEEWGRRKIYVKIWLRGGNPAAGRE